MTKTSNRNDGARDFELHADGVDELNADRPSFTVSTSDADACERDELVNLFAALEDVSASDELKASTLAFIEAARTDDSVQSDKLVVSDKQVKPAEMQTKARPAGRGARRSKFRALRIAGLAACLAFAMTGGVAYALPTAHVQVEGQEGGIELGVNCFGIAVTAASEDADLKDLIDAAPLVNKPYEEALDEAWTVIEAWHPDEPVEISVEAGDPGQRSHLEDGAATMMARHQDERRDLGENDLMLDDSGDASEPTPGEPAAGHPAEEGAEPLAQMSQEEQHEDGPGFDAQREDDSQNGANLSGENTRSAEFDQPQNASPDQGQGQEAAPSQNPGVGGANVEGEAG